jgi:hypothetical protein
MEEAADLVQRPRIPRHERSALGLGEIEVVQHRHRIGTEAARNDASFFRR